MRLHQEEKVVRKTEVEQGILLTLDDAKRIHNLVNRHHERHQDYEIVQQLSDAIYALERGCE